MTKELEVGDRVRFINKNYIWFDNEYIVTDIGESVVYVVDDHGGEHHTFKRNNLQVIDKEPTKQTPADILQRIQTFTKKHKNLEISFGDGKVILRDWDIRLNEPMDYHCDTIEQLEELMVAWGIVEKFKVEIE